MSAADKNMRPTPKSTRSGPGSIERRTEKRFRLLGGNGTSGTRKSEPSTTRNTRIARKLARRFVNVLARGTKRTPMSKLGALSRLGSPKAPCLRRLIVSALTAVPKQPSTTIILAIQVGTPRPFSPSASPAILSGPARESAMASCWSRTLA